MVRDDSKRGSKAGIKTGVAPEASRRSRFRRKAASTGNSLRSTKQCLPFRSVREANKRFAEQRVWKRVKGFRGLLLSRLQITCILLSHVDGDALLSFLKAVAWSGPRGFYWNFRYQND